MLVIRLMVLAAMIAAAAGCPGSAGGAGASCDGHSDCDHDLQCLEGVCVPQCLRAPDCGDGYACDEDKLCVRGILESGDRCASEVQCGPGLSCVLDAEEGDDGILGATCTPDHDGHAFGAACDGDAECRNGTCALGRCIDVCLIDRDCAQNHVCTEMPRIDTTTNDLNAAVIGEFQGCLPERGSIYWSIPVDAASDDVYIPVPGNARSIVIVMTVEDPSQLVGATHLLDIDGNNLYRKPLDIADFYNNLPVRHVPAPAISTLMFPSSDRLEFVPGVYRLGVSSLRPPCCDLPGSATPRVTAIAKLGEGSVLDLHFNFLDLSEHPCMAQIGKLDAAAAASPGSEFQAVFIAQLRLIFARAGIALGATTYDDVLGHPDLDGLDSRDLPSLLSLSTRPGGVNMFFVRTMSPVGLQALVGANPGDPLVGSMAGGVAISVDTLCYRGWTHVARVAAHALARHMGLFRNIEPPIPAVYQDPIVDSDISTDNLMHYSEFGGSTLSAGQRAILRGSAVLQ